MKMIIGDKDRVTVSELDPNDEYGEETQVVAIVDNEQKYAQFRDKIHAKLGDVEDSKESAIDEAALGRGQDLGAFDSDGAAHANNFPEGLEIGSSDDDRKKAM